MCLSFLLELGNDEVYYTGYARQLQLNYFDHPPLVAFILKIFSFDLRLRYEGFLRIGFIVTGAFSAYIVYCIVKRLRDSYTGWIAVWLFIASPYAGIISGMMIMPDAPLLLFWLLTALQGVYIAQRHRINRSLILLGLFAGLAMLSKVSAAMLWLGFGLYVIIMDRALLRNPFLYMALCITLAIASPLWWWDTANTVAGRAYHAERVLIDLSEVNGIFFLRQVLGAIGYNNPVCYMLAWAGVLYGIRKKCVAQNEVALLILFSLPLIILVDSLSLFRETLPHWTGPSFSILSILGSVYVADRYKGAKTLRLPRVVVLLANLLLMAGLVGIVLGARYAPPFNATDDSPQKRGRGDLFLDMTGWDQLRMDFMTLYQKDVNEAVISPHAYIIAGKWFPGAHLDWYVAQPNHINLLVAGGINDLHQYAVLNASVPEMPKGSDAYYITCSNYYLAPDSSLLRFFHKSQPAIQLPQKRLGYVVRYFFITRLRGYKGGISRNGIIK